MAGIRNVLLTIVAIALYSCSAVDVSQYKDNQPKLHFFEYFQGITKGWGIVQDRKGNLTRQFVVDIKGTINDDNELVLHEDFLWNDGEVSQRTWTISRIDEHNYSGKAEDVEGTANGISYGSVLNWKYHLNVKIDNSTWKISFDDWMFLQPDEVLINKAKMSKFGFKVGEVTIVFKKMK